MSQVDRAGAIRCNPGAWWRLGRRTAGVSFLLIALALTVWLAGCPFVQYDLTISSTEGGTVSTPGRGTFSYKKGTEVNLLAEPEEGYRFANWIGDVSTVASVTAAATTITMRGDYTIVASFGQQTWEIRTWHDLAAIKNNLGRRYVLMNNLDSSTAGYTDLASEVAKQRRGWEPLGHEGQPFTGSLEGQGYEIRDLFINRPDETGVALFGEVGQTGIIKNLGLANVTVTGGDYVGGLVGHGEGTVGNCYSTGDVTGEENVGALVGHNGGMVSDSYSAGSVTGNSRVGGLVGWNQATLMDSYSACTTTGDSRVGGLVGDNWYYASTVTNSYATGSVAGSSHVGGLVGANYYASLTYSYSIGSVAGGSSTGGLVGYNTGIVSDSFWDIQTSGQPTSDGGTGKATAEMKSIATFSGAGWSISAVAHGQTDPGYRWNAVNGQTYPFLSWQAV
jgi:hypothetical protein